MSRLTPGDVPSGIQMLRKALAYEKFCLRNYRHALSQANPGDKPIWERLISDTEEQLQFLAQSLQVNGAGSG